MSDKVQLKREEIAGSLTDINPITNTKSVSDSSTGSQLDTTIDRIWKAINNKLSRVVNSVNGRTGVVVLGPEDVGLGNVDNVSYETIKKWVLEELNTSLGDKCINLFDSLQQVDDIIDTGDMSYKNTTYFASNGYANDFMSYIGYIYYDNDTNSLQHIYKQINVVGYADNSIIYNENVNGDNKTGGGIGVNIYKYEDALKIYNAYGSKDESGLYIDKSKIANTVYHMSGAYGNGLQSDVSALLYFDAATIPADAKDVSIFYDDIQIVYGFKIRNTDFKYKDIIICDFKDYRDNDGLIPVGMCSDLLCRNTAVGQVTAVPNAEGVGNYRIDFHSIKQKVGWGLQQQSTHRSGNADSTLELKLMHGGTPFATDAVNVSGLQVLKAGNDQNPLDFGTPTHRTDNDNRWTVLPTGIFAGLLPGQGGLLITPDISMCVMPCNVYGEGNYDGATYVDADGRTRPFGSKGSDNWAVKGPYNIDNGLNKGALTDQSLIGLNLYKAVDWLYPANVDESDRHGSLLRFCNMSGLKLMNPKTLPNVDICVTDKTLKPSMFGLNDNEWVGKTDIDAASCYASGGLMINVGKFLEVDPGYYNEKTDEYYNTGKLNVRIGKGLRSEPTETDAAGKVIAGNRIQIKINNPNGGLAFDENDNLVVTGSVSGGAPTAMKRLEFVDNYGSEIVFNPSSSNTSTETQTISLGAGLKITI